MGEISIRRGASRRRAVGHRRCAHRARRRSRVDGSETSWGLRGGGGGAIWGVRPEASCPRGSRARSTDPTGASRSPCSTCSGTGGSGVSAHAREDEGALGPSGQREHRDGTGRDISRCRGWRGRDARSSRTRRGGERCSPGTQRAGSRRRPLSPDCNCPVRQAARRRAITHPPPCLCTAIRARCVRAASTGLRPVFVMGLMGQLLQSVADCSTWTRGR